MANETKQYFLAPSWDYPPNGPIALGNIILSPSRPVPPLLPAATLTTTTTDNNTTTPTPLITSTKTNLSWTRAKSTTYTLGIWTKFVEFLGLNLGFATTHATHDLFRFERVHTEEFFPDDAYLAAALQDKRVQRALEVGRRAKMMGRAVGHRGVYVVVGVKTVSGARVRRVNSRGSGVMADVGVDAALVGAPVPVAVGPAGGAEWEREESTEFEGSDDFVFAYRVQKVWLREKGVGKKDYVKGAMFGMGDGERAAGTVDVGDLVVNGLGVEDVDDTWTGSRVVDGEGEVEVFVPVLDSDEVL